MKEVIRYEAEDGKLFHSAESALEHDQRIEDAQAATEMFSNGASLWDSLMRQNQSLQGWGSNYPADDKALLMNWRKDDAMAIPHWQCRDERGYKVERFDSDGDIFIWGNAGSWSGPYGGPCTLMETISYIKQSLRVKS